jgi:hypothetical protein
MMPRDQISRVLLPGSMMAAEAFEVAGVSTASLFLSLSSLFPLSFPHLFSVVLVPFSVAVKALGCRRLSASCGICMLVELG